MIPNNTINKLIHIAINACKIVNIFPPVIKQANIKTINKNIKNTENWMPTAKVSFKNKSYTITLNSQETNYITLADAILHEIAHIVIYEQYNTTSRTDDEYYAQLKAIEIACILNKKRIIKESVAKFYEWFQLFNDTPKNKKNLKIYLEASTRFFTENKITTYKKNNTQYMHFQIYSHIFHQNIQNTFQNNKQTIKITLKKIPQHTLYLE